MADAELNIEHWPLERLVPYARNPRKNDHAVDQVASAIREFGFKVPVIVKSDGTVVDGHLRLKAARKLGLAEVPVVLADDLTEAQVKAFRISVNRMAELGEWDNELLGLELEELLGMDVDLAITGLDDDFVAGLLAGDDPSEPKAMHGDPDEVPEPPAEPVVKPGDLFVLGKHRILCGDSTNPQHIERLMDGAKADMVFTDPPYGMEYKSNRWDSEKASVKAKRTDAPIAGDDTTDVARDALRLLPAFMADAVHLYVWCRWDCFEAFKGIVAEIAKVKGVIVWDKGCAGLGDLECSYGDSEWAVHAIIGRRPLKERQNGVWQVNRLKGLQMVHPTQKPVALSERAILNSTDEGDIVLDMFGGSGSTLMGAETTGRAARLIELKPGYVQVTIEQWTKLTGQEAYLLNPDGTRTPWSEMKAVATT